MSAKSSKKGKSKVKDAQKDASGNWRALIENTPLDDECPVKVVMIDAAGGVQDRLYLEKFETFSQTNKRFVIKSISKNETTFMIKQLGQETNAKDENKVFAEAENFIKENSEIPTENMALIIKHLIMKLREEYLYIKEQKIKVTEGMKKESEIMLGKTEVKGLKEAVKTTVTEEPPASPERKGKKGKKETSPKKEKIEDEDKKFNTQLRVRGEEWRDKVYVEDYPIDGPNLYIAVTNFSDPYLPACLNKIGVPVTAVIQVRIEMPLNKVPSGLTPATKRGQSQTDLIMDKTLKFWKDLLQLRIDKNTADTLKNTAFILYTPPYWDSDNLTAESEKIYDEICFLMYDVQDLTRQHINFLDNIEIHELPESDETGMIYKTYQETMESLPFECTTIYSIIDSMLGAVDMQDTNTTISSVSSNLKIDNSSQKQSNDKIKKAEYVVSEVFKSLCETDEIKKTYRITYGKEFESLKEPIITNFGDKALYTTFHCGNLNLRNIILSALRHFPLSKLWDNFSATTGDVLAKINFHVNVLLSCFEREDVETAELRRLIHILTFRKLYNNRSSLKELEKTQSTISKFKKHYLKRTLMAEPIVRFSSVSGSRTSFSNPNITKSESFNPSDTDSSEDDIETKFIKSLFECPDISELLTAEELKTEIPTNHLIDDFEYYEDFKDVCAYQVLLDAFNEFSCINYNYCAVTDCIVMMFFNSHDQDGLSRHEWRSHIPTAVCLQDFFDFILEEYSDWILAEEAKHDARLQAMMQSNEDGNNIIVTTSCIDHIEVDMDILMEGSLKYQDMVPVDNINQSLPSSTTKITSTAASSRSRSKKKSPKKTPESSTKEKPIKELSVEELQEQIQKPFSGYNLGDRRVEAFGKDNSYYSKDGTKIRSHYSLLIPNNVELVALNIVTGHGNNEIFVHKILGEQLPEENEIYQSFKIHCKDNLMINIKKHYRNVSIEKDVEKRVTIAESNHDKLDNDQSIETLFFYSLYITWPNGLVIETVYEDTSPVISHIKQTYTSTPPNSTEETRCLNFNGEVIIFKSTGQIEICKPDATYINITQYRKSPIIVKYENDEIISAASSTKSKEKNEKTKKNTPIKSPKISETAETEPVLNLTYDLLIEKYELIEPDGEQYEFIEEELIPLGRLLMRTATDYNLGEVFSRRSDGTNILLNGDGVQTVTFPNGIRIITVVIVDDQEIYPEWTEEELELIKLYENNIHDSLSSRSHSKSDFSHQTAKELFDEPSDKQSDGFVSVHVLYTIEHINYATVNIDRYNKDIQIVSPNNTSVTIDINNLFNIKLDDATTATFDGNILHVDYEACPTCKTHTTCDIQIDHNDINSTEKLDSPWLQMQDSFCKRLIITNEGALSFLENNVSQESAKEHSTCMEDSSSSKSTVQAEYEMVEEVKRKSTVQAEYEMNEEFKRKSTVQAEYKMNDEVKRESRHTECRERSRAKLFKFFVLKRNMSCSELVNRKIVEDYWKACETFTWCSTNSYDTFGDHRRLVSILYPIFVNETEKWLMESKLADKPENLTFKDLKKDCKKGFYSWMRPYKRFEQEPKKPKTVLPPLPRAFVLRILEQQWNGQDRETLKGARELVQAIIKYCKVMALDCHNILHNPIIDHRSHVERKTNRALQVLGRRIYEQLKQKIADDISSRATISITTDPAKIVNEESVSGEGSISETLAAEGGDLTDLDSIIKMSPNLQRYWDRRAELLKEEEFYLYLLREASVPPYFLNMLGGAIWWEVNHLVDVVAAGDDGQKNILQCICADEVDRTHEEVEVKELAHGEIPGETTNRRSRTNVMSWGEETKEPF